jgi:cysteine sulfinate desulfinase/cysteine desulfurase-like protein
MKIRIYLDCNATTQMAPGEVDTIQPFLIGHSGNPLSSHP